MKLAKKNMMKRLLQFGKKYRQRTKSIFSKMMNYLKIGQFGKRYRIISVRNTEVSVRDTDKELNTNNKTLINKIYSIKALTLDFFIGEKIRCSLLLKTCSIRRIECSIAC